MLDGFKYALAFDFEYGTPRAWHPEPRSMVAIDLKSSVTKRLWLDGCRSGEKPCPFPTDGSALWLGFFTTGDLQCFKALGWEVPKYLIDLYVENHCLVNDGRTPSKDEKEIDKKERLSLLATMRRYGEATISETEKDEGRELSMRGGIYTCEERERLLIYNHSDSEAHGKVALHTMRDPRFSLNQALWRAAFMKATAEMEWTGIPVDRGRVERFNLLRDRCIATIVQRFDPDHEIFAHDGSFVYQRLEVYLERRGIRDWPRFEDSGLLKTDEDALDLMVAKYPTIKPFCQALKFKRSLETIKEQVVIGPDGRSRGLMSPFGTKTSRNRFDPGKYVLARPSWQRSLFIRPELGQAIGLVDFEGQEMFITAVISGDEVMLADYLGGDMHLTLAIAAGLVPPGGTKKQYYLQRTMAKQANFCVLYGGGAAKLARTIGTSIAVAQMLLDAHRKRYARFWDWSAGMVSRAFLEGEVSTLLGWKMKITRTTKPTTVKNFFAQANGAEVTRAAAIMAIKDGVEVCGPLHDSLMILAPESEIEERVAQTQAAMVRAARFVLGCDGMRTEAQITRYPDELVDEKGAGIRAVIYPILGLGTCGN